MVGEFDLLNKPFDEHLFADIDNEADSDGHGVSFEIPQDYIFDEDHWRQPQSEAAIVQADSGVGVFDKFVGKEVHRIHLDDADDATDIETANECVKLCRQKRNRKCQKAMVYVKGVHHKLQDEVTEITIATREYAEHGWKRDWALNKMRELRWKKIVMPRAEFLKIFFDYSVYHDESGSPSLPELPRDWSTEERFHGRGGFTNILRTSYARVRCKRGRAKRHWHKYHELYQYDYRINLPEEQSPYISSSNPEVRNKNLYFELG